MTSFEMKVLNDGNLIPGMGFGTYKLQGEECSAAVESAIQAGYRLFDTAEFYQNEESVGLGIKKAGIPREEVFIASKVWIDSQQAEDVRGAFERSLVRLGVSYLDLYLIHWPVKDKTLPAWKVLEALQGEGLIRSIGVCNMDVPHLEALLAHGTIKPAVNQIEVNLRNSRPEIVSFCQERDILVQAWRPLINGEALAGIPELMALAEKYKKTPAQITLRWIIQRDLCPLVKSSAPMRMRENLEVFDFHLWDQDMAILDSLNQNKSSTGIPTGADY